MSVFDEPWPATGLETLGHCPVCGAAERASVHSALTDRIFFCAPGVWTMYRCADCGSGYLDPRPTPETIGQAYETYYTHEVTRKRGLEELGLVGRLRRALASGYRNNRYGTAERPATPLGVLLRLAPGLRTTIDTESRHIPKPPPGGRLLDVGCGDGSFLDFARRAGWSVVGVDFDRKAVDAARSRGLDIRLGGIEVLSPQERFDGITMSHVIEHVHDPMAVLRVCYGLLKPGGWLWLETPNLDALGHRAYGPDWRGLEPPRHLVLFSLASIRRSLTAAGFTGVTVQRAVLGCEFTFSASEVIARGESFERQGFYATEVADAVRAAERTAAKDPAVREFITVKAFKR